MVAAMTPRDRWSRYLVRIVLSLGLSVGVLTILGFLNLMAAGFRPTPDWVTWLGQAVTLLLYVIVLGLQAYCEWGLAKEDGQAILAIRILMTMGHVVVVVPICALALALWPI